MRKIRVVVAEDSLTVRKYLLEILGADKEIEVVGEAEDGRRAIELCESLRPDVMTLDMMMPLMTGVAATEYIMAYCPTPILIVSASINRGELFRTYDALAAGAIDVLEKPKEFDQAWNTKLVSTLKLIAKIKVITHPRARLAHLKKPPPGKQPVPSESPGCRVVAIGASTGGPGALVEILRELPEGFPLPILLVVHIGQPFGLNFAEWLDGQSPLRVAYARHGQPLPSVGHGQVLMAPPDQHLEVHEGKLRLSSGPERHSCRPSVDVLFESVARELGSRATGCLLTGMGKDGASGLLAIRKSGGVTLAQDEATSVVFGMPKEAIELGAAQQILPLQKIAPILTSLAEVCAARSEA